MMDRNITTIFGVTLVGIIGVSILSPAFPEIKRGLELSDIEVAMLVTAFTLPGIFLAPMLGILADRFGRKKVLVPCLFLFGISGSACAFVNFGLMLVLRFLQGIGGSALTSLAITLIGDLYDGVERTKLLGYNAGILSLGLACFPFFGGLLASIDWRLPFLAFAIAIPIGILALTIDSPKIEENTSFFQYIRDSLRILKSVKVLIGFLSGCAVFLVTYGAVTIYLSFLLEEKFGVGPRGRGMIIAFTFILVAIVASNLEFFLDRFGWNVVVLGFLSYTLAFLLIPISPNIIFVLLALSLFGFGHGTVLPSLQNLVVSMAPIENRGAVTTAYSSMIRVGQTLGPIFASEIAVYSVSYVFFSSALITLLFALLNKMFGGMEVVRGVQVS